MKWPAARFAISQDRPTMIMRALPVIALLAACTSEETDTSIWTIHTQAEACPAPHDAHDTLFDTWGYSDTNIDGKHCQAREILESAMEDMRAGTACCYAATCTGDLNPVERLALYEAVCHGLPCSSLDLTRFSADQAASDLAMSSLACTLISPNAPPTTQADLVCTYAVTALYSCSSVPG